MSIARRGQTTRGFTIFEVIVTMGILTIMVLIMQGTIDGATRAERRLRACGRRCGVSIGILRAPFLRQVAPEGGGEHALAESLDEVGDWFKCY